MRRPLVLTLAALAATAAPLAAQSPREVLPPRAIRRDIPITNTIRHAYAAGTRDSTGRPTAKYWQLFTDYTIAARLDVPTNTVTGHERIVVTNASDTSWRYINLRLDQNIFAPNAARADAAPPQLEITTGMHVTRLTVGGQAVNLNPPPVRTQQQYMNQTANGPVAVGMQTSVATIRLQQPIAAGASTTIEADWSFEVSAVSEGRGIRMGRYADSLYQLGQWYPRVMVYDDLRGWDDEPYLGRSEFYNNFGHWDVSLDVPAGWLVGATGLLQNPEQVLSARTRERLSHVLEDTTQRTIVGAGERGAGSATAAGDRLVWHFAADTAGDFAWATSRAYVWDATRATIPGENGAASHDIPVNILYMPGDTAFLRVGPVLRHALEFYSGLWMPYAFPQLTDTDGPELGMEYPMFIMSGLGAADHETGHEWWPMMVGNNETWYGWMDEGFNTYMNQLSAQDAQHRPFNLNGPGQQYGMVQGAELESPMMWPANYQADYYGFTTYPKTLEMMSMLGGVVGDTAVMRAQSLFAHAWRFKHPSPWDWMFMMQGALHQDLGWFWNSWLFTTSAVDGRIDTVTTRGNRTTVVVRQNGDMPSPVVLKVKFAPGRDAIRPMRNAVMVDSVTAIVTWPVDVWFGGSRTFQAELDFGKRPIERIIFDPQCRFPDHDVRDNMWPRDPGVTAPMSGRCYGT